MYAQFIRPALDICPGTNVRIIAKITLLCQGNYNI